MWNEVFREHKNLSPTCDGFLRWDQDREEQRGLVWAEAVKCETCSYQSKKFNLYDEVEPDVVKRGRKAARLNRGIQIGLMQTPIGNASLRRILLSANVKPPSIAGMQKMSKKVSQLVEEENTKDMKARRMELMEVNKFRNTSNPAAIDVEGDGLYNNPLYSGVGRTPFQPATQCSYIMVENSTPEKKIISLVTKNKLCSKRGKHRGDCGEHNPSCPVTLDMNKTIGNEKEWARECMEQLKEDNLEVHRITTDPDTSAFRATEDFYQAGSSKTKPEHYLDTRHLSENVRKQIKNDPKVIAIMPGSTKAEREKMGGRFSLDMTFRCTAERDQAGKLYKNNFQKVRSSLSYAVDAIVECYFGDHSLCEKYSYVCDGGSKNWISKSSFLRPDFKVMDNSEDAHDVIRKCVNLRLGPGVLNKTMLNTTSNKSESANKTIRRSVPRHTTFSAVFSGRCHSGVHASNHGAAESIAKLCDRVGCPIAKGSSVAKCLKSEQNVYEKKKLYNSSEEYMATKCKKRRALFDLYEEMQEKVEYKKGTLLTETWLEQKKMEEI